MFGFSLVDQRTVVVGIEKQLIILALHRAKYATLTIITAYE